MIFKGSFIYPAPNMGELTIRPSFEGCDACGEPFSSVAFGGRGNVDHMLYELCVDCAARIKDLHATAPDSADLRKLTDRVRWAVQLRYAPSQGSA
jgi:hypothetical protein